MKYNVTRWMLTDSLNTRSFSWTADSRLASLTAGLPTGNETYTYSPFGTRAKVGTRPFLRAGAGVTAGVLDDGNAEYTPGVSEVRSGSTTFSHSGLKHMAAQTDAGATPAVQATRTYDAFGATQSSTGSWQGPFGTAGAFGYQTEPSGLHLLGHRYYDASTGRFLARDPIGDGNNWYVYCGNSPLGYADFDGLAKVDLRYRRAFGPGYHTYIVITDEVKGGNGWAISGGPAVHDPWYSDLHPLEEGFGPIGVYAGPFQEGNYDWRGIPGLDSVIELIDDDLSSDDWIERLSEIGRELRGSDVRYSIGGPNSNSFAREVLQRARIALPDSHPHWVPGWSDDPWSDYCFRPMKAPLLQLRDGR